MSSLTTFGEPEIAARLAGPLRHWRHADGAIRRTYKTHGWKGTLMAVNAIGHLCEVAWHHPELQVTYDAVSVALSTHDANGVTERDFALAAKIEDCLTWQPGAEAGALEGTPTDPRHAYLRFD